MGAMRIFLTLWLKHYLLSCVVDAGYSASRHPACPRPWRAWLRHSALELLLTIALVYRLGWSGVLVVSMELLLLGTCCLLERHANSALALRTHLSCESAVLVYYGVASILIDTVPG